MARKDTVLKIENLTKSFGAVRANDHVHMELHKGEILAILGENGSGKTTLINMIAGIYFPDEGNIYVNEKPVCIKTPKDAYQLGIGVVHQHFKLVNRMNAVENIEICLNAKEKKKAIRERMMALAEKYGFSINPDKKVCDMSVSEKQTVEIVKVLMKGANILILDEPTAVLTPQEAESLFQVMRMMKEDGKAIVIITHKLQEVLSISDTVLIMRKGMYVDTIETAKADEQVLTEKMVGRAVKLSLECPAVSNKKKLVSLKDVSCNDKMGLPILENISFDIYSGEILGVAGIAGSGQKELCEVLAGIERPKNGQVLYYDAKEQETVRGRNNIRIGFVPEDRLGMGLVSSADMVDNMMLRSYREGKSFFINRKQPLLQAKELIEQLEIATPGVNTPVRMLSGGNVQKILLGREIKQKPELLIVSYPVRGLDINSSYTVYHLLNKEKQNGTAIVFVGEDLDVLMGLSDRIMILSDHGISGIVKTSETSKKEIGYLMTKSREGVAK